MQNEKMLDTVILRISKDKMRTLDNAEGCFPNWTVQSVKKGYVKWIKNMPKQKDVNDPYYPRLTMSKSKDGNIDTVPIVSVEFSAPKLLYPTNLDEIEEKDFLNVCEKLKEALFKMGEIVARADIENAIVSTFHPSKNIQLFDGYTAHSVLKELSKINVNKKMTVTKTVFGNDGNSLQIYSIEHSIVFYDKISDLNQKKKRAVDRDQTFQQFSLFTNIKTNSPTLEVLRMEMRLCSSRKISSVMSKLGFEKNPTFRDVFRKDVCQKVVRLYWDTVIKGENLFLFELSNDPMQLYKNIFRKDEKIKVKQNIYLVGLNILCKCDGGIRELRDVSEKRIKRRNWYCVNDGIKLLNKFADKTALHSWVKQIDDAVTDFKPYNTGFRPP